MMRKHSAVLIRNEIDEQPQYVLFHGDDSTKRIVAVQEEVILPVDIWLSMGCPDEITVDIRPGDQLTDQGPEVA